VPIDHELCKLDEIWVRTAAHDSDATNVDLRINGDETRALCCKVSQRVGRVKSPEGREAVSPVTVRLGLLNLRWDVTFLT
jgi:hypothetical protein